ncbi:M14 family metallopeptidase [Sediminibacterium ginsengisoli]|uniref:Zinc carboxypeptidase n=1 Tax=Sediminibacterium ginsengisoli TaxID=413434 RepID=A0A1T4QIZ2_9BACT|nr:M14 family metallopeptidase [Sediminibacterium ginsengisoli]SKA03685.1 Zinc carboxypeptidase [Sediminibacterium ginsengisoli]
MKRLLTLLGFFALITARAQEFQTVFEKTKGEETVTYDQCITYYKKLDAAYPTVSFKTFGLTDAGYPLQLVLFSKDKSFDPQQWHRQGKVVIMINNGIHPGEPDGIDASMMLLRDLASGKIQAPANVVLGVIPVYNIGGSLNRTSFSRVNQDGPKSYGFRGSAQNLDLNRDFIKSDSREAKEFATIFHWLNPDILIDNHVSDGADYQYTMTLLTTQHNKLGGAIGNYLHDVFEPLLYKGMTAKQWPMTPYVNFEDGNPERGWTAFYDPPRYSSGYAALFQTMSFMPETHMLKPFKARVEATYALMQTFIESASGEAKAIKAAREASIAAVKEQDRFYLSYKPDTSRYSKISFMGYEAGRKKSDVTGMDRMFYDHSKPFTKEVKFYNQFAGYNESVKPAAYIIPQGWHELTTLLQVNHVLMQRLARDTEITVTVYRIEDYKTATRAYEKHYRQSNTKVSSSLQKIPFRKGDYLIYTGQHADRFLVETLDPAGDDGYFTWNFFDAILQQKEGYSNYRWEDVAAAWLNSHPELRTELEEKKKADAKFAASASAQLDFVYKRSPYYEPAHMRYPVYRIEK